MAAWLSWWSYRARQQREAVEAITAAGGTTFYFQPAKYWPSWLVETLGVDYFANVKWVGLNKDACTDGTIMHLKRLTGLKTLALSNKYVSVEEGNRLRQALPNIEIYDAPLFFGTGKSED